MEDHDLSFLDGAKQEPLEQRDEASEGAPPFVRLMVLAPESCMQEDLMVFVLEHKRLANHYEIEPGYAIDDLVSKFPDKSPLKAALAFNAMHQYVSYDALVNKVIEALVQDIKLAAGHANGSGNGVERPSASTKGKHSGIKKIWKPVHGGSRKVSGEKDKSGSPENKHGAMKVEEAPQTPLTPAPSPPSSRIHQYNSSNATPNRGDIWFYVDDRGRTRPTMALKDWREWHGLCRACGASNHVRANCQKANRIANWLEQHGQN